MVSLLSSSKDAKKKRKRVKRKSSAEGIRLKVIVLEATKKQFIQKKKQNPPFAFPLNNALRM